MTATTTIEAAGAGTIRDQEGMTPEAREWTETGTARTVIGTAEVCRKPATTRRGISFDEGIADCFLTGRNDDRRRSISPQALPTRPRKDAAKPPPPARSPPRRREKPSAEADYGGAAQDDDEDMGGADDDDIDAMQAMMGFGGFGTTKGKQVAGNRAGGVRKEKKTEYRQYMNRQGGFNRPLSPGR